MTNRVALGALPGGGYGLRVSRPGHNVLDTGLLAKNVAFDSRWLTVSRLHQVETVTITPAAFPSYQTFGFGVDFGVLPPIFAFTVVSPSSTLRPIAEGMSGGITVWENYAPLETSKMRVFTNQVQFLKPVSTAYDVRYIVLRPL